MRVLIIVRWETYNTPEKYYAPSLDSSNNDRHKWIRSCPNMSNTNYIIRTLLVRNCPSGNTRVVDVENQKQSTKEAHVADCVIK